MNQPYDVFISYARDDAARAQIVRERLEALGLHVFFDAEGIDSGQEFPVVIDRAVKTAKCVLGLWSRNAFDGRWVRIESRIGLDQGKLVAGMIDGTRPEDLPAEFYNVNVENLADYHGQADHPGWNRILRVIGKRVGRSDIAPRSMAAPRPPPTQGGGYAQTQTRGGNNGLIYAIGGAAAAAIVLLLVLRNSDNSAPPQTPPATEISGAPPTAIPVPKPDDQSRNDSAREEAAQREAAQREAAQQDRLEQMRRWGACEGGSIAACRAYLQQFPDGEYVRAANARIAELTPPPAPVAADLSGQWQGYYEQGANRTPFAVRIEGRPGAFAGRMAETNTFADRRFPQLFANIQGRTQANGAISFTKTYDGTAGQTHSVEYQGRLDDGGRTITGTWRIDSSSGPFRMQRQ